MVGIVLQRDFMILVMDKIVKQFSFKLDIFVQLTSMTLHVLLTIQTLSYRKIKLKDDTA